LCLVVADIPKGIEWTDAFVGGYCFPVNDLGRFDTGSSIQTLLSLDGADTQSCGFRVLGRVVMADIPVCPKGTVTVVGLYDLFVNAFNGLFSSNTSSAIETLVTANVTYTIAF